MCGGLWAAARPAIEPPPFCCGQGAVRGWQGAVGGRYYAGRCRGADGMGQERYHEGRPGWSGILYLAAIRTVNRHDRISLKSFFAMKLCASEILWKYLPSFLNIRQSPTYFVTLHRFFLSLRFWGVGPKLGFKIHSGIWNIFRFIGIYITTGNWEIVHLGTVFAKLSFFCKSYYVKVKSLMNFIILVLLKKI